MLKKYKWLKVRSRNHSADALRKQVESFGRPAMFRINSNTETNVVFPGRSDVIEINTKEACHNSGNKTRMKKCFCKEGVKTAYWANLDEVFSDTEEETYYDLDEYSLRYPLIIKHNNSCGGRGIYMINNDDDLMCFQEDHSDSLKNYIVENYHNFSREYRLHVTKDGCFHASRKMLKTEAEDRWHRHDSNSCWIMEENELFDKPTNWDEIVKHSVLALKSVGLDIGAVDVKCTSAKTKTQDFIILEVNSGPSLGETTAQKYIIQLQTIINNKINDESFNRI
jgi:glutathione synthase/RimK-type ligase-like ATP-grasp enzyme